MVKAAIADSTSVVTSMVAYAEVRSALSRVHREGNLDDGQHRNAVSDFDKDWSTFDHVDVLAPLAHHAGELAETHALRGFDAVHLASALYAGEMGDDVVFLGFDTRLINAARNASLPIYGDDVTQAPDGNA